GVGTTPSTSILEDDGGISSDNDDDDSDLELDSSPSDLDNDDEYVDAAETLAPLDTTAPKLTIQPSSPILPSDIDTPTASFAGVLSAAPLSSPTLSPTTPTSATTPSKKKKIFPIPTIPSPIRRLSGLTSSSSSSNASSPLSSPSPLDSIADEGAKKPRLFRKSRPTASAPATPTSEVEDPLASSVTTAKAPKMKKPKRGKDKDRAYSLDVDPGNDILGIVMLEVVRAEDLPRLKNMTRTSFDMDPFAVISFGTKVFRTRVVRHSLNPVWDEKLLFHVRSYETRWDVRVRVSDWDKISSNDFVGEAGFEVQDLIRQAPQKNPETGMYDPTEEGEHPMVHLKLRLEGEPGREAPEWEGRHTPVVYLRAKYQPYDLLRQRFWRKYLAQYDTDDTHSISHIELTSLLDSLGSTLTQDTVDAFWESRGKKPHVDELSVEEAVESLERELGRPEGERRRVGGGPGQEGLGSSTSASATPALEVKGDGGLGVDLSKMDFAGKGEGAQQPLVAAAAGTPGYSSASASASASGSAYSSEGEASEASPATPSSAPGTLAPPKTQVGLVAGALPATTRKKKKNRFRRKAKVPSSSSPHSASSNSDGPGGPVVERVINVKSCPLCHRPRLSSKAEMDIVTHLAVCASADWGRVDRIVVGNFVTASQAQRKWYTRMIGKIGGGEYALGANSANIIVQNRETGQLEEEKMQVYVRLGIRLLYKGATSRMEGGRARRLLKSLSIKQGVKYDAPQSAADIPGFIEFHGLNIEEILDPLDSFKTFNEFFYRKLKPSARPIDSPDDPYRLVSAADCRLMAFETVDDATRLWIKGREFSVARLLGEAYAGEAERYRGGALAIFRLAPQDYHRFHSPVEGTVGAMSLVAGEYYTVNGTVGVQPQAIRSSLDVYGENVRKIVPIESPQFGRVMAVCIGAMMVGSIKTTVEEGEHVHRGQEFGYFAFGGSTIVVLFEKDRVEWDEDLLINGRASLETLVRVGSGLGRGRRPAV
ncbi:hypothetical protein H0H87_005075, partial [Tephrocybe sp. NHM501043]